MLDDWTAEVVGRMHDAHITGQQLADECGYSAAYLSTVLNHKRGNEQTKQNVFSALSRLEENRRAVAAGETASM